MIAIDTRVISAHGAELMLLYRRLDGCAEETARLVREGLEVPTDDINAQLSRLSAELRRKGERLILLQRISERIAEQYTECENRIEEQTKEGVIRVRNDSWNYVDLGDIAKATSDIKIILGGMENVSCLRN